MFFLGHLARSFEELTRLLQIDSSSLSCSAGLASRPALQGVFLDELHLFLFEILALCFAGLASQLSKDFRLAERYG